MKTENKMRKDLIFVFALVIGAFLILKLKQDKECICSSNRSIFNFKTKAR